MLSTSEKQNRESPIANRSDSRITEQNRKKSIPTVFQMQATLNRTIGIARVEIRMARMALDLLPKLSTMR